MAFKKTQETQTQQVKGSSIKSQSKSGSTKSQSKSDFDIYQMVTDRILAKLEEGIIPWEREWTGVTDGAFSRVTKKPYSFMNQLMLKHTGEYATWDKWKSLGATFKEGEKPEQIVFWSFKPYKKKKNEGEEEVEEKTYSRPILRYYNVYHISQVEGVEPLGIDELPSCEKE